MKHPAFQFYPGDWYRSPISGCSLAAQGLWLRLLMVMHDSEPYGYLVINGRPIPDQSLANKCGCSLEEFKRLLQELDFFGVPNRKEGGIIYSNEMVESEKNRKNNAKRKRKSRGKIEIDDEINIDVFQEDIDSHKNVTPDVTQMSQLSSSSSSSSTTIKKDNKSTCYPKKPMMPLPDNFMYNQGHVDLCNALGVNLEEALHKFTDYHLAKGSKMADWNRALSLWIRNDNRFGKPNSSANLKAKKEETAIQMGFRLSTEHLRKKHGTGNTGGLLGFGGDQ